MLYGIELTFSDGDHAWLGQRYATNHSIFFAKRLALKFWTKSGAQRYIDSIDRRGVLRTAKVKFLWPFF